MISIGDVHPLEAGTSLRFEARGKAVFDDAISSEVRGSQTFSLMRVDNEYARFRYTSSGLVPCASTSWCSVNDVDEATYLGGHLSWTVEERSESNMPAPSMQVRVLEAGRYLVLATVTKTNRDCLEGKKTLELCVNGRPQASTHTQNCTAYLHEPIFLMDVIEIDREEVDGGGRLDLRIGNGHPNNMCIGWLRSGAEGWICLIRMDGGSSQHAEGGEHEGASQGAAAEV